MGAMWGFFSSILNFLTIRVNDLESGIKAFLVALAFAAFFTLALSHLMLRLVPGRPKKTVEKQTDQVDQSRRDLVMDRDLRVSLAKQWTALMGMALVGVFCWLSYYRGELPTLEHLVGHGMDFAVLALGFAWCFFNYRGKLKTLKRMRGT